VDHPDLLTYSCSGGLVVFFIASVSINSPIDLSQSSAVFYQTLTPIEV
jgi:hypothetical protein